MYFLSNKILIVHFFIQVDKNHYSMETETSQSPVLQSERMSFDDTANFHR